MSKAVKLTADELTTVNAGIVIKADAYEKRSERGFSFFSVKPFQKLKLLKRNPFKVIQLISTSEESEEEA